MDEIREDVYKMELPVVPTEPADGEKKPASIDYNQFETLEQGRISTRLPIKVKSGSIDENNLTLQTTIETRQIPWESVEFIALGMINEEIDTGKAPKSKMRSLINQFLVGEQNRPSAEKKNIRDFSLIDIFIKGEECQYRIDQTIINYRGFIEKTGYVSSENFNRLARKLVYFAKHSKLNASFAAYLTKTKADVKKYPSILDFELDTQAIKRNNALLTNRTDLNIEWEN